MVLYRITLVPLAEDLGEEDPGIIYPFYADNAAFNGAVISNAQLFKLIMEKGLRQVYFPNPAKLLFIAN